MYAFTISLTLICSIIIPYGCVECLRETIVSMVVAFQGRSSSKLLLLELNTCMV